MKPAQTVLQRLYAQIRDWAEFPCKGIERWFLQTGHSDSPMFFASFERRQTVQCILKEPSVISWFDEMQSLEIDLCRLLKYAILSTSVGLRLEEEQSRDLVVSRHDLTDLPGQILTTLLFRSSYSSPPPLLTTNRAQRWNISSAFQQIQQPWVPQIHRCGSLTPDPR